MSRNNRNRANANRSHGSSRRSSTHRSRSNRTRTRTVSRPAERALSYRERTSTHRSSSSWSNSRPTSATSVLATAAATAVTAEMQRRAAREARERADRARFESLVAELSRCQQDLPAIRRDLQQVRVRGYRFQPDLEDELAALNGVTLNTSVTGGHAEALAQLQVQAGPFVDRVSGLRGRVDGVRELLDRFSKDGLGLREGESPVGYARVSWTERGATGDLLLTDQRVRFEQNQAEYDTVLLIFRINKRMVRGMLLDEPIGRVDDVTNRTDGFWGTRLLTVTWKPGGQAPDKTTFKVLRGSAKEWDALIEAARDGTLPMVGVDVMAAAERSRWPTKCDGCGASLPEPLRGITQLVCEYCGTGHAPLQQDSG